MEDSSQWTHGKCLFLKWWTGWVQHCMGCGVNPLLCDVSIHEDKTNILMVFASQTRASNFGRGHRVVQGSVDCAPQDVAQAMVYVKVGDPMQAGEQHSKPLICHPTGYFKTQATRPTPAPQLAVPVEVVKYMMETLATTARTQKLKDL
eukprot:15341883-Ditylum_brightwellii.AAC.1